MSQKNLFKKKSINLNKFLFIILIFFSLLTFIILLFISLKQQFFIVPEFIGSFYIIPQNKGGTEVINLDKKSWYSLNISNSRKSLQKIFENLFV